MIGTIKIMAHVDTWDIRCIHCGEEISDPNQESVIDILQGIIRVKCPECGKQMEVEFMKFSTRS